MSFSTTDVNVFIVTDGGNPNAGQRKDLATVVAGAPRDAVTHVFTMDPFVRAVVSTFRWIGGARAFAYQPIEFGNVCARCGVSPDDIMNDFADVQKSLPEVLMLRRVADKC
jgi:hypothetical protein